MVVVQLSILNAASIFGRILPNFVADKIGPYNMIIPFSFSTGVLLFGWLGVSSRAGLIMHALLYGFFSGAFISLLPSVLMVCPPRAMRLCLTCWYSARQTLAFNVGEIGVRVGFAFFAIAFGALTGTPISGYAFPVDAHVILTWRRWIFRALLGDDLQWWKPVVFSGISVFAGTTCLIIARHLHAKEKGTWKV